MRSQPRTQQRPDSFYRVDLKIEYLGICKAGKFQHLNDNELLITTYPYRQRQGVLNELVANAVVGYRCLYRNREIKSVS